MKNIYIIGIFGLISLFGFSSKSLATSIDFNNLGSHSDHTDPANISPENMIMNSIGINTAKENQTSTTIEKSINQTKIVTPNRIIPNIQASTGTKITTNDTKSNNPTPAGITKLTSTTKVINQPEIIKKKSCILRKYKVTKKTKVKICAKFK